jgi:hypothetical protein
MKEAKFKIGDRVKAPDYATGDGVISDVFMSHNTGWMYEVTSDDGITFYFREE